MAKNQKKSIWSSETLGFAFRVVFPFSTAFGEERKFLRIVAMNRRQVSKDGVLPVAASARAAVSSAVVKGLGVFSIEDILFVGVVSGEAGDDDFFPADMEFRAGGFEEFAENGVEIRVGLELGRLIK